MSHRSLPLLKRYHGVYLRLEVPEVLEVSHRTLANRGRA